MLLTNSVNDPGLDAQHIRLLRRRRVDGLLLSLADETAEETAAALEQAEIPRVLIDRDLPSPGNAGAVLSDHAVGITAAAEHLISLGHKRIGLVNGNPRVRPARERERALRRACRRHPGTVAVVRSGSFTAAHGEAATASLLAAAEPVTAIIAGGNQILAGVLQAMRQAGMQAPSGVSLVTCDDVPLSGFLDPPIATITRNPEEMGTVAAEILLEQLHGRMARSAMLPVHFRATASCGPATLADGVPDDAEALLRSMLRIRFFEDEVKELFTRGLVRGSTHLCQGQEAVAVGVCGALRSGDTMTCTYRGHGAVLAMGAAPDRAFGELLGRADGLCGGKGGSMHFTDVTVGAIGANAIVGGQLPLTVGAALAAQYLGTGAVSVTFLGDGATNIGAFHESLNLAAIWHLPAIFVIENNHYGEYRARGMARP